MCFSKAVLPALNNLIQTEGNRGASISEGRVKDRSILEKSTRVVHLNDVIQADSRAITLVQGFHQNGVTDRS